MEIFTERRTRDLRVAGNFFVRKRGGSLPGCCSLRWTPASCCPLLRLLRPVPGAPRARGSAVGEGMAARTGHRRFHEQGECARGIHLPLILPEEPSTGKGPSPPRPSPGSHRVSPSSRSGAPVAPCCEGTRGRLRCRPRQRNRGPWLAGDSPQLRSRPCARSLPFRSPQAVRIRGDTPQRTTRYRNVPPCGTPRIAWGPRLPA